MNILKAISASAPVCALSALALFPPPLRADLPASPLAGEYTVTGGETIHGEWWNTYEVAEGGVLNILGEYAQLQINYAFNSAPTFFGDGTVNIGSDTEYGRITVSNASSFNDSWNNIINFTGTINVGARGDFSISGGYPSHYGAIFYIGTLNVDGTVSVMSDAENNLSYFRITNLAMREGGLFASAIDLQSSDGSVYDFYGNGLSAPRLRVSTGATTINLRAQNVLDNLSAIDFDSNNACVLKINADASNAVNILTLRSNSTLELAIAEGQTLLVKSLRSREGDGENMSIIFRSYIDGSFMLGSSDIWIEDNRLYLPSTDAYIDLFARDSAGGALEGVWSLDWNGEANVLHFAAVPEPASAALLGIFALIFAARARRRF